MNMAIVQNSESIRKLGNATLVISKNTCLFNFVYLKGSGICVLFEAYKYIKTTTVANEDIIVA